MSRNPQSVLSQINLINGQVRKYLESRRVTQEQAFADMKWGEWGWAHEWAMVVGDDGRAWLDPEFFAVYPSHGDGILYRALRVRRTSASTWQVDTRTCPESRWMQGDEPIVRDNLRVCEIISLSPPDEWGRQEVLVAQTLPVYLRTMTVDQLRPGQSGYAVRRELCVAGSSGLGRVVLHKPQGGEPITADDVLVSRDKDGEVHIYR